MIVLCPAVKYWRDVEFDSTAAWLGLAGGFSEAYAKTMIQNACVIGPAGPAVAISSTTATQLVIADSILSQTMISPVEMVSFIFSTVGSLVLVVPNLFTDYLCKCCFKKPKLGIQEPLLEKEEDKAL